uniref:Uncharacterized protein n=1 Tax=Ciona savignyi TaxID=51511 RepID=H2ZKA5_CIOSA
MNNFPTLLSTRKRSLQNEKNYFHQAKTNKIMRTCHSVLKMILLSMMTPCLWHLSQNDHAFLKIQQQ